MDIKKGILAIFIFVILGTIVLAETREYDINLQLREKFGVNFGDSAGFNFVLENDEMEYNGLDVKFTAPEKKEIKPLTSGCMDWSPGWGLVNRGRLEERDWKFIKPEKLPRDLKPYEIFDVVMGIHPALTRPGYRNISMNVYEDGNVVMSQDINMSVYAKNERGIYFSRKDNELDVIIVYNDIGKVFKRDRLFIELQVDSAKGKETYLADVFRVDAGQEGFIAGQRFEIPFEEGAFNVKARVSDGKIMDILERAIIIGGR